MTAVIVLMGSEALSGSVVGRHQEQVLGPGQLGLPALINPAWLVRIEFVMLSEDLSKP